MKIERKWRIERERDRNYAVEEAIGDGRDENLSGGRTDGEVGKESEEVKQVVGLRRHGVQRLQCLTSLGLHGRRQLSISSSIGF